jgi:hypothetical protein
MGTEFNHMHGFREKFRHEAFRRLVVCRELEPVIIKRSFLFIASHLGHNDRIYISTTQNSVKNCECKVKLVTEAY